MATGGPRRGHWGIHVSGGKRGRRAPVDRGALGKAWENKQLNRVLSNNWEAKTNQNGDMMDYYGILWDMIDI